MPVFVLFLCARALTSDISGMAVLTVCALVILLKYLLIGIQKRYYSALPMILANDLDAEKYLEVCLILHKHISPEKQEEAGVKPSFFAKLKHSLSLFLGRSTGMASLSLANAYYSIGDFKNARRVLDRMVIQGSKSQQLILETFFDAVNFNICAAQKDLSSCNMS